MSVLRFLLFFVFSGKWKTREILNSSRSSVWKFFIAAGNLGTLLLSTFMSIRRHLSRIHRFHQSLLDFITTSRVVVNPILLCARLSGLMPEFLRQTRQEMQPDRRHEIYFCLRTHFSGVKFSTMNFRRSMHGNTCWLQEVTFCGRHFLERRSWCDKAGMGKITCWLCNVIAWNGCVWEIYKICQALQATADSNRSVIYTTHSLPQLTAPIIISLQSMLHLRHRNPVTAFMCKVHRHQSALFS